MQEEEKTADPLDTWFSGPDETKPQENVAVETDPEEPEEIENEKVEEVEDLEEEPVEDDDYEAPIKQKKDEEDDEVIPESKAVERAKIEGKARKALELEKKEWELEKDRLAKEKEALESRLKEFESTKIKPTEHPDFVALRDEILIAAKKGASRLDAPNALVLHKNLGSFIERYRKATTDEDLSEFKNELAVELFTDVESLDDLDKGDRRVVLDAIRLIDESTEKADKLENLRKDLEKRATSGTLAMGVREYERTLAEYRPLLDAIGDLDDELIEANPHAIESVVAKIAKSEEGKKRLNSAKKDAIEIIYGPRPLTQEEMDKMVANGTDIKAFNAARQKAVDEKRKKLLPMTVHGLVTRAAFKEMAEKLAKYEKRKSSEDSEDDAIRKHTKKKVPIKKEEKVIDPVTDIWFGEDR